MVRLIDENEEVLNVCEAELIGAVTRWSNDRVPAGIVFFSV